MCLLTKCVWFWLLNKRTTPSEILDPTLVCTIILAKLVGGFLHNLILGITWAGFHLAIPFLSLCKAQHAKNVISEKKNTRT